MRRGFCFDVLAALLIGAHKCLGSLDNLVARSQEGSCTLDGHAWDKIQQEGTYSFSSPQLIIVPTCPQADRDSGSQTTAATLSLVHWEQRLAKDFFSDNFPPVEIPK